MIYMASAKKLPSGQWRTLVYDYTDSTGKRHYESFTAETKKESEFMAAEFALNKKRKSKPSNLTLGEAIDEYINSLKPPITSITTIAGYKKIRKYAFQNLMDVPLKNITEKILNQAIVTESSRKVMHTNKKGGVTVTQKTISPKTVRNEFGLISAVLNVNKIEIEMIDIRLPEATENFIELLSPKTIYSVVKGTEIELAVLLAMWLSFSESEICGLTKSKSLLDNGRYICINEVVVNIDGKEYKKERGKTKTRKRVLELPPYIKELIDKLPDEQDRLVNLSGHALYDRFRYILKKNNLPHMTFHQLRHVNATVMSKLRIPDKHAQERGGWKTDKVMKKVYTHTFTEDREEVDATINNYFETIIGIKEQDIDMKKYKAWLLLYDKSESNDTKNEFKTFMQHEMQHKN